MTLNAWMGTITEKKCEFRVEKVQTGKRMVGGKKYGFKVTTMDPLWDNCPPAIRTKRDFGLLQKQLESRFPNAVVPKIQQKEVENLHLMEIYLQNLSLNPFFRMDVTFADFLNGKKKEFKQTKKNDRKHSQGTLRWLQQTTEYKEVDVTDDTIKSVKVDLEQLKKASNSLIQGITAQIKAMADMQNATGIVAGVFSEFLAVEQASENKVHGSASGLPPGKVKTLVSKLMNLHTNHQKGLQQSYDGGSLERLTINHLIIFIREINGFKRLVDLCQSAKHDFDKAKQNFDSIPNENPSKEGAKQALGQKDIVFYKEKRALAFELEKFRTFKTIKIGTLFQNICKYHLRGAKRITDEWSQSGVSLNDREEQQFLKTDAVYSHQDANPVGRNRSNTTLNRSFRKNNVAELKSLEVIQGYSPGKFGGGKYLKVSKGELLTGSQIDNGDWQVTNNRGQKGIVKSSHVQIAPENTGFRPAAPGPAPGLPQISLRDNIEDEEWSVSGDSDNGNLGFGSAKPAPIAVRKPVAQPTAPLGLPPGLSASNNNAGGFPGFGSQSPPQAAARHNPAPPPSLPPSGGGFGKPPVQPPGGGFGLPPSQAPSGGRFGMPPAQPSGGGGFGMPSSNAPSGGGFGMPSQPPNNGGFGMPPSQAPRGGAGSGFGASGKPSGGGFNKPPAAAPKLRGGFGSSKKKKPKFGGGGGNKGKPKLGGGMPGGKPNFLADIGKGNNMNKLKKVPDSDKSKEIGGNKGLSAADKGKGKKAAPSGGGGGLMGEMAFALKRRG